MIGSIVLGLLLLASFVACYFCSNYWHWAQVLLVETLFLFAMGYFLLAAENWRIQRLYGEASAKYAQQIDRLQPQVDALQSGTSDLGVMGELEGDEIPLAKEGGEESGEEGSSEDEMMLGLRQIDHQLALVTRRRGRVWREVMPVEVQNPAQGVTVQIETPNPHGVEINAVLYLFQQGAVAPLGEQGPQYLGEFRVTDVAPQQVELQATGTLDEYDIERLQQRVKWIMYENMPSDEHPDGLLEIFAGATPAELKQLLPAESVEEYLRHNGPRETDDDQWHLAGYDEEGNLVGPEEWDSKAVSYRYHRQLRDYHLIFQEYSKRLLKMIADLNALEEDNRQLAQALVSAKQLAQAREKQQQVLRHDLDGATRDRQAIERYLAALKTQLQNAQALLQTTRQENAAQAAALR